MGLRNGKLWLSWGILEKFWSTDNDMDLFKVRKLRGLNIWREIGHLMYG